MLEKKSFDGGYAGNINYYLYLPKDYQEKESFPLIIFLHGAGERGTNLEKIRKHGIPKYLTSGMDFPAVILCPQCPPRLVWNNIIHTLKALIDHISFNYKIDKGRISITGSSMGGFGTWEMGMTYPNFFSALAPVCGGGMIWRCSNLKAMPIWAFHGDGDTVIPLHNSIDMVDSVNNNGGNARLTIIHKIVSAGISRDEHNCHDEVYLDFPVINWLISQKRTDFSLQKEALDEM